MLQENLMLFMIVFKWIHITKKIKDGVVSNCKPFLNKLSKHWACYCDVCFFNKILDNIKCVAFTCFFMVMIPLVLQ
jgi:hypothetical protein